MGLLDEDRKGTQRTAVTLLSASLTSVSEHMPPISASSAQSHIGMPPRNTLLWFSGDHVTTASYAVYFILTVYFTVMQFQGSEPLKPNL